MISRPRAVALLLVLIAVVVSSTVAYSYLAAQGTSVGIARNISGTSQARFIAESGIELTMGYIRKNAGWRAAQSNGTWLSDQPLLNGRYTIRVEDGSDANGDGSISIPGEGDGDLKNDPTQTFTITSTGVYESPAGTVRGVAVRRAVVYCTINDMTAYWKFDDGTGTSALDFTGKGHTCTLMNLNTSTCWVTGKMIGGLRFSGGNNHAKTPQATDLNFATAGTVSAWIYTYAYTSFAGILHKGSATNFSDEEYSLQFWSGNKIYWGVTKTGGGTVSVTSPSAIPLNTWKHLCGTWDATAMKLYIDGTQVATRVGTTALKAAGALNIGAQLDVSPFYAFNGIIDDVRIYNRAISDAEVTALAAGAAPATGAKYVVDWRQ